MSSSCTTAKGCANNNSNNKHTSYESWKHYNSTFTRPLQQKVIVMASVSGVGGVRIVNQPRITNTANIQTTDSNDSNDFNDNEDNIPNFRMLSSVWGNSDDFY
jgi:hypothetical protein